MDTVTPNTSPAIAAHCLRLGMLVFVTLYTREMQRKPSTRLRGSSADGGGRGEGREKKGVNRGGSALGAIREAVPGEQSQEQLGGQTQLSVFSPLECKPHKDRDSCVLYSLLYPSPGARVHTPLGNGRMKVFRNSLHWGDV